MDEKREWWIDAEIDPRKMHEAMFETTVSPGKFKEKHPNIEARGMWVKNNYFVIFHGAMEFLTESIQRNKKARIVVEYDPRQEKFFIGAVRERDGSETEEVEKKAEQNLFHP